MASILHIDSSPRGVGEASAKHSRSKSRKLAKEFVMVTYRDLRQTPVPHVTED